MNTQLRLCLSAAFLSTVVFGSITTRAVHVAAEESSEGQTGVPSVAARSSVIGTAAAVDIAPAPLDRGARAPAGTAGEPKSAAVPAPADPRAAALRTSGTAALD